MSLALAHRNVNKCKLCSSIVIKKLNGLLFKGILRGKHSCSRTLISAHLRMSVSGTALVVIDCLALIYFVYEKRTSEFKEEAKQCSRFRSIPTNNGSWWFIFANPDRIASLPTNLSVINSCLITSNNITYMPCSVSKFL